MAENAMMMSAVGRPELNAAERMRVNADVNAQNAVNKEVNGRTAKQEMGKDEFLTLLMAQLAHQDPTKPMEDTQFIAQMAQFSSLEQIGNMSSELSKLGSIMSASGAVATLGKTVDLDIGGTAVSGVVEGITWNDKPELVVNGSLYGMEHVKRMYSN